MRNYPLKYRWIYLNEKYYLLSSYESSLQLSHRVKIITLSIVELKKEPSARTRFDSTCRAPLIKLAASQRVGEIIRRVLFFLVSKKFNLLRERARIHTYTHTHAHTLYLLLFRAFCSAREFFKGNRRTKESSSPLFRLPFQSNFTSFAYIFIFRVLRALSYRLTFAPRSRSTLSNNSNKRCWGRGAGVSFMYYSRYGTRNSSARGSKNVKKKEKKKNSLIALNSVTVGVI